MTGEHGRNHVELSLQSSGGSWSVDLEETRVWDSEVQDELYVLVYVLCIEFVLPVCICDR